MSLLGEHDDEPIWSRVRLLSIKVRALAYLLGNQADEDPPNDLEEIQMGYGMILTEIALAIREASTEMEEREIRQLRSSSRKKV